MELGRVNYITRSGAIPELKPDLHTSTGLRVVWNAAGCEVSEKVPQSEHSETQQISVLFSLAGLHCSVGHLEAPNFTSARSIFN